MSLPTPAPEVPGMPEMAAQVTEQQLSTAQRLGNLLVSAPVEAGVAYLALSSEVTPHTPGQYAWDLALSALAYVAARGAFRDVRSAFSGRGTPGFQITRPGKSQ